jgi:hypothetical protein
LLIDTDELRYDSQLLCNQFIVVAHSVVVGKFFDRQHV